MTSGSKSGLKRFLLWDYARTSWQYDVIVALILGFVFLTPREFFRDQPRGSNIVRLPAEHGTEVFWLESELLSQTPESERASKVEELLAARLGKRKAMVRLETIFDSEREVKGYMAFVRP